MLEPFEEISAKSLLQLSLQTHFARINYKKNLVMTINEKNIKKACLGAIV